MFQPVYKQSVIFIHAGEINQDIINLYQRKNLKIIPKNIYGGN